MNPMKLLLFRKVVFVGLMALPLAMSATDLALHERGYLASPGVNVLVYNNAYDGNFSDSKIAGIELIHHDVRTATNGDVRLSPTPEQWDPVPVLRERRVDPATGVIEAELEYPDLGFNYTLRALPDGPGVRVQVLLAKPLPGELEGKAGFNLEFLPSAYWESSYMADARPGLFPRYPHGPTGRNASGGVDRLPLATAGTFVLAPENPERRVTVESFSGPIGLYDGRNQAQNGWFVLRTLLPSGRTGAVVEWRLEANTIPNWMRPTVISHSQVGYHPGQAKVAVLEMDPRAPVPASGRILRVMPDGQLEERLVGRVSPWGKYLRYNYATFDFSEIEEPGIYVIEIEGRRTGPVPVSADVLATAWHPTLDVFMPVQMDHMFVNEAYRVWHGRSHLDDARQAPPNHLHFDLYAMGPTTETDFEPGEHIPGLAVGGWFDAGDYDLRTQTNTTVVSGLVHTWEEFRPERDETAVDQRRAHVELHQPDGKPDILQQIEHGVRFLLAQHRVIGHAIPGIVEPDLGQYTHLGDAATKTDNRIYDPSLGELEVVGDRSGVPDDRWAFTTHTTALNYGSAAALAAASRALRGYDNALAQECLDVAQRVWAREQAGPPALYRHGNTTGGHPGDEEIKATVELLLATNDARYAVRLGELWPVIDERFVFNVTHVLRVVSKLDETMQAQLRARSEQLVAQLREQARETPFGVPITRGGWAGNGRIIAFGIAAYQVHRAFPDLLGPEHTLDALEYLLGRHPGSSRSFVSAVGAQSKTVAYGSNRADFSFIAGGIVPGVLIIEPDLPENKEDWPFLWGQNEYVVNMGASYLFLVHAAERLLNGE